MKMISNTKNIAASLFISVGAVVAPALASTGEVTGKVQKIRSHDISISSDIVTLSGVATAGTCGQHEGLALFYIRDEDFGGNANRANRHYSTLLAAKISGKKVTIAYDDVGLKSPVCWIKYIDVVE